MSERSRGPEGASSPAPTRSNPSGGDDIYAAAAASAAGRNAKRSSGSASRSSTAGGAGSSGSNGSQPANKPAAAQKPAADKPAADKPAAGKAGQQAAAKPTDGGKPSPGKRADRAAGSQQSGAGQSGAGQSGAADQKSGAQGGWASRADGSGDSGDQAESGDGPTSKLSAVASGLLSKVRGRSDDDTAPAPAAAGAQSTASTGAASSASRPSTAQSGAAGQSSAAQQSAAAKPAASGTPAPVAQQTAPQGRTETSKVVDAIKSDRGSDKPRPGAPRGTRKARLRLSRLDPWSVMKTAFLFSIAAGIVMVVAVYAVWLVIGSSGLFSSVDSIVGSVLQSPGDTTPFRIEDYVNTQKVMGVTAFLACIDVVIFTALATLASFLYNLAATMLGGLEVTLAED